MGTIPKTKLNTVIMALLLVFTSTLSMYQSPVSPLIELDEDQTPSNTGNSTGCGYNASLASISNVSISPTSPSAGDDITFYIDLSCVMVGYINGMTWAGSLSSMPNDYSNWYANSSTHSISFTWYNASSGNYSLYGNYNYQPNANSSSTTSLDGINWGFSVGSASSQSEYVDADTNGVTSINSSSTFVGNVTAHNLQSYTSYTIFTMIYDVNTNVSVTANYWNITTGNWNTWSTYPNASNMNAGYYCLAAYVSYYGNASYLDYDLACFSVTGTSGNNSGTTSEWIDTNTNGVTSYTTTSTFVGNVTAYNLMSSTSYTIYTMIYDVNTNVSVDSNYYNITTGNWNTWSTYPNASNMNAGYYCLAAYISYYGNASYIDYDLSCFTVTSSGSSGGNTTSDSPSIEMFYDPFNYTGYSTVQEINSGLEFEYELDNLIDDEIYEVSVFAYDNATGAVIANYTANYWIEGYSTYNDYEVVYIDAPGTICVNFVLSNSTTQMIAVSDELCFEIYVNGEISIELTNEDWVELGICWENESLNEAECEAAGYEWDDSYSDWVVITDYAIGDMIEWEINLNDLSEAEYQVVLDITHEGQDIISVTKNLTSYYSSNMLEIGSPYGYCEFMVDNQWGYQDCLDDWGYWSDYEPSYDVGEHCFAVSLYPQDSSDLLSSDEVCHTVYATGDINIELTNEDWVEVGICWENESLNEAECEAAGYEWDDSYSDWVVITDYAIGDMIEWEINIEDISDADYQVVLDITHEGQDIISVTRNLTSYYNSNMLEIGSPYGYCEFMVDNEWGYQDCIDDWGYWSDYEPSYDVGEHCFIVTLYLHNSSESLSSSSVCHTVYATGDISIELTNEDWVEVGICWEDESLNEAECEAEGYVWDDSYSDWVVITDYAIGDMIEWEINIEDISDADYQVVLDITHEGQDIISVTRNLTSYYNSNMLEIGSPYGYCEFMVDNEWGYQDCLDDWGYWSDYEPSYDVGEHCFAVSLYIHNTSDSLSSSSVCHYVYATGEISIELTEEYWVEVGTCWEDETLSEDECDAEGFEWDPYYSDYVVPTEYSIGSVIGWEITIDEISDADYQVVLDITHEGQDIISVTRNLTSYYNTNMLEIGSPYGFCEFMVDNEWGYQDCIDDWGYWSDYEPSYDVGEHCFTASLYLHDSSDMLSSNEVCHTVFATGEISIELTEEYWVEVGTCWEDETLSEDECDAEGFEWDPYYSDYVVPTEYSVGSVISWNVEVEDYSYADYKIMLDITHDGEDVVSTHKNISGTQMMWFEIGSPYGFCDFEVHDEMGYSECLDDWFWSDYNPSYDVGEHCFTVTLVLQNGGDFSATDQVCHTVYDEEITEEETHLIWDGMVNEEIVTVMIPASSQGVVIDIGHLDIHPSGYGIVTFHYKDGTSESFTVVGNNAMNIIDSTSTVTRYGGSVLGDYTEGIMESAGLTQDYSFEQTSAVGKNTWVINAYTMGLHQITFEESSDWRGFTDMQISHYGEKTNLLWEGMVNEETVSIAVPSTSEGIFIDIGHLDIHTNGFGKITFIYEDGTSETLVVWGNNAMNVVDASDASTKYGGALGDYSEGIIATSGLTKDYSFEQFSYAGNNTWLINARTVGLEEIVFEESSDWRGFTKMKILYIGEEATNETTFREGDSDNDGVPDEWDECPETATDAFTDRNGCEVTVDDLLDGNGADAEGMPGFTAVFAVIALLGAIVVTHRKEE